MDVGYLFNLFTQAPIFGAFFGLILLIAWKFRPQKINLNASLLLFLFSAILGVAVLIVRLGNFGPTAYEEKNSEPIGSTYFDDEENDYPDSVGDAV